MKSIRVVLALCAVTFGLVLSLARPATAAPGGFERLPGEPGKQSPLLLRIVEYQGHTNGAITVEVKNPTGAPQEFSAKGVYFVPTGDANEAPQRLGAVGPFQLQRGDGAPAPRIERATIAPGAIERVTLDVYCIDSHRASPGPSTGFRVAKDRVPASLVKEIDADAARAAQGLGGVSARPAKSAVQSEVWRNRDKKWIELDGEGRQEAVKSRR